MSKRYLAGWSLRGRSRLHPYLYDIPITYHELLDVIKYRRGDKIKIDGWEFSIDYGLVYLRERRNWYQYLPPEGVRGARVLDVGAGCGETAKFFLENGARRVYAIENNYEAFRYLVNNSRAATPRFKHIIPIGEAFDPGRHLNPNLDLVKVDIEGYEIDLLYWLRARPDYNVNIVLETHSVWMRDRFLELGFTQIRPAYLTRDEPGGFTTRIMYRWKK